MKKLEDCQEQIDASGIRKLWLHKTAAMNDLDSNHYDKTFASAMFDELPNGLVPGARYVCVSCASQLPKKQNNKVGKGFIQNWVMLDDFTLVPEPKYLHRDTFKDKFLTKFFKDNPAEVKPYRICMYDRYGFNEFELPRCDIRKYLDNSAEYAEEQWENMEDYSPELSLVYTWKQRAAAIVLNFLRRCVVNKKSKV